MKEVVLRHSKRVALSAASLIIVVGPMVSRAEDQRDPLALRYAETSEQRDKRMGWWREARFGMFVHWGLFSASGGTWEGKPVPGLCCWMQHTLKIPIKEYGDALMPKFSGENFDPDAIAQLAVDAGMKYIVPITKHHEGFCLFDSRVTDFKITRSPAGRDWIRELADASRARGLKVGFYYSQNLDWYHHDGERGVWNLSKEDADRYVDGIVIPQLRELLTGYGDVSILWWDIPFDANPTVTRPGADRMLETVKELQPGIIMNNRLDKGIKGDFETPEQMIPVTGSPDRDWETCQTINGSWSYTHHDRAWKSVTTLVRELIDTTSKGGNYLLNIGPKPDGSIPQNTIDTLKAMGGWMKVHGESIYGTRRSPFPDPLSWGRCTRKDIGNGVTRLYFQIFEWPFDSVLHVPSLDNEIVGVSLISQPGAGPLDYGRDENGDILIQLPVAEPNDYATVVALDINGAAQITGTYHVDDVITLYGDVALIHGGSGALRYDPQGNSLGYWIDPKDMVTWTFDVPKAGRYHVDVSYGCPAESAGGEYAVDFNGETFVTTTQATDGWHVRRTDRVAEVEISEAGQVQLDLRTVKQASGPVMDLQRISLVPAIPRDEEFDDRRAS